MPKAGTVLLVILLCVSPATQATVQDGPSSARHKLGDQVRGEVASVSNVGFEARQIVSSAVANVSATITLPTVSLVNGDLDGDNEVTSTDLSVVLANLAARGGQGVSSVTGDLDGDNRVTNTDVSIVLKNLDVVGEP